MPKKKPRKRKPVLRSHHTSKEERPITPHRQRLYDIIFESDTPLGQAFDIALLGAILLSVLAVILESVSAVRLQYGRLLYAAEWFFTILFSIEYLLRLASVRRPRKYALSFFGVIDLLAVIPTYLSLIFSGAQILLTIRILRFLRLFRVLKLTRYLGEAHLLKDALRASRFKISVFLLAVLTVVVIVGAMMYMVEGPESGFTSIPRGIYWAIVTMTTVGYGDIAPRSLAGQTIAAVLMVLGYGIIAVPTGIVSVELAQATGRAQSSNSCSHCEHTAHDNDAYFCKKCGRELHTTHHDND
jgi:voltage-gated potassium channel